MSNLFVIGIFLAFFLQFLLVTKKNKCLPDKILSIWMFVIGIHLFSFYIYSLGFWEKFPHLVGITHPVPLLHGPLLYLYVVSSLRERQSLKRRDYLHFIPALAAYLYMIPFFLYYSAKEKAMVNHQEINDYHVFMVLSLIAFIISGISYSLLAFQLINRHNKIILENFSYDQNINLNWLRYCISGIAIVFLAVMLFSILQDVFDVNLSFNPDYIYYSLIIVFIFFLGFNGIRHEGIFTERKTLCTLDKKTERTATKRTAEYKNSGLKTGEAKILHEKLLILMTTEKLYLEPKLNLNTLANKLDISTNYLSQIINQYQNKNFFDFVNSYRVKEFKTQITSPKNKHLNILAVALDSGFNSKSSFNMVFKKQTGMTPSQFLSTKE